MDAGEISGADIVELMKATGMTRKGLAQRLGVDPTTVLRWEQGKRPTGTAAIVLRAAIATHVKKRTGLELMSDVAPALGLHELLSETFKDVNPTK